MSITREGKALRPEKLHSDYVTWITEQHEAHDEGATFNEESSTVYFSKPHNKEELGIKSDGEKTTHTWRLIKNLEFG